MGRICLFCASPAGRFGRLNGLLTAALITLVREGIEAAIVRFACAVGKTATQHVDMKVQVVDVLVNVLR